MRMPPVSSMLPPSPITQCFQPVTLPEASVAASRHWNDCGRTVPAPGPGAGPDQLHRTAHRLRDLRRFDHLHPAIAPAETAADVALVVGDLLLLEAERFATAVRGVGRLRPFPDLDLSSTSLRRATASTAPCARDSRSPNGTRPWTLAATTKGALASPAVCTDSDVALRGRGGSFVVAGQRHDRVEAGGLTAPSTSPRARLSGERLLEAGGHHRNTVRQARVTNRTGIGLISASFSSSAPILHRRVQRGGVDHPGGSMSMPKVAVPLTLSGVSRRGTPLPSSARGFLAGFFSSLASTFGSGDGTLPNAAISP